MAIPTTVQPPTYPRGVALVDAIPGSIVVTWQNGLDVECESRPSRSAVGPSQGARQSRSGSLPEDRPNPKESAVEVERGHGRTGASSGAQATSAPVMSAP